MAKKALNTKAVIDTLNRILELELAGVVRYLHYSLMVFGWNRLPLVTWMRQQGNESLLHAATVGEHITALGGHPSLTIGKLLETERHEVEQILDECIVHERGGLALYAHLLDLVKDRSVLLEEFARQMVHDEELHVRELEKMIRRPGDGDGGRRRARSA